MMTTIKHSKFRNTGILFELLSRQIAVDVLNNNNSKSIIILKKYFNENTTLGKESRLYQTLINEKFNSETKATHFLDNVIKNRQKLVNSVLRREKYNLIKEIKETFNIEDFFKSRIPNYKVIASIYKLFQAETVNEDFDPSVSTKCRFSIIEHITQNKASADIAKETEKRTKKIIEGFEKQDKDLKLLSYQILVDKFNNKYKSLNSAQRNLLKEYINNISNTNSLREFIDNEVVKVKKILKKHLPKVDDPVTKIKLNEAINQTSTSTTGKLVRDKHVVTLMRYYQLIKELDDVHSA
jgi:hypothetical protein|tara:strand:+ start:1186 stop:2073 length:888 start_codon:yes stop_codon:yes gene_type:complete